MTRKEIAQKLFDNTRMTKEQYEEFKQLYEDFELEYVDDCIVDDDTSI